MLLRSRVIRELNSMQNGRACSMEKEQKEESDLKIVAKKRGKFIVLEGPDGFGKTTQTEFIVDHLMMTPNRFSVIRTKEPGSPHSDFCLSMRESLFRDRHPHDKLDEVEEGLLFFLDHYHHARMVGEAVEQGAIVVSDRWCYSQYCYNRVRKEGRPHSTALYLEFEPEQIQPDLVIILGLDKDEAMRRLDNRPGDAQKRKAWAPSTKDKEASDEYLGILLTAYGELAGTLEQDHIWCGTVTPGVGMLPEDVFEIMIKPFIDRLIEEK